MLYLIEILHQTTTCGCKYGLRECCILSKFYIKPQLARGVEPWSSSCILSKFYIKPQLYYWSGVTPDCCILSKFYIKPQHITPDYLSYKVVSYRNSTSNHNSDWGSYCIKQLYLIEILHQTTTPPCFSPCRSCCILSKFYIKPQLVLPCPDFLSVVSYRNSTSNHNRSVFAPTLKPVVSYRNSTSNHNPRSCRFC